MNLTINKNVLVCRNLLGTAEMRVHKRVNKATYSWLAVDINMANNRYKEVFKEK
jgi:hypothetical protein